MKTSFGHVAIVARDVERLVTFYENSLGCVRSGPPRDLHGPALEDGMGLRGARVRGVHLALPTEAAAEGIPPIVLEIFALPSTVEAERAVNQLGLMHLCFRVDDIAAALDRVIASGGSRQGSVARVAVEGVGAADFVYTRDPEGNLVELQAWV